MAKKTKRIKEKPKRAITRRKIELPFGMRNYTWFGIGILVIVIGYIFLATGSLTLAPILLVAGYCVIIPISIIISSEKRKKEERRAEPEK
jgi:hypothetical protein